MKLKLAALCRTGEVLDDGEGLLALGGQRVVGMRIRKGKDASHDTRREVIRRAEVRHNVGRLPTEVRVLRKGGTGRAQAGSRMHAWERR